MSACETFLDYFDELAKGKELPEEVKSFYEVLRKSQGKFESKVQTLSEKGEKILLHLQSLDRCVSMKSSEIALGMGLPPKQVSGSMRKLVELGYVEKFGDKPILYTITEKGKNYKGDNK